MNYAWLGYGVAAICFLVQILYCKIRHLGMKGFLFVLFSGSGILAVLGWFHLGLSFNVINLAVSLGLGVPGLILLLLYSGLH